jgi:hypothetical protein
MLFHPTDNILNQINYDSKNNSLLEVISDNNQNILLPAGLDYIGLYLINQTFDHVYVNNQTKTHQEPYKVQYWAFILIIFPILTFLGNLLVILSVIKEKNLRTVTNYFVVSLAVADLTVSALVMPLAVYLEVTILKIL